ncbi:acyl-CoA dehydrogenase family protein [Parvimonas sp. D2]|uniref:acyl-CoA dehydrogenase family protein n=1 Tax=unclassified Parvimonas TaxID=1151464 RepID=UPI002B46F861|nr:MULTISPECIES: acyl-CoA dehydrogenase family protein [unclassified Parvimonas]MEB3012643.1 acyl-CoA dehydrogenase family protein [Parvimonas sp. D2]MEB3088008.1 acyl-CoA dehydrogenase family protein [Parvimonas sp. D4]
MRDYYKWAKEFSDKYIKPVAEEIDEKGKFPKEIFDKIKEEGFFKVLVPVEFGGEGAGPEAQAYITQAFAEGAATVGLGYTMHNVALKFVLTFANEELKKFIISEVAENNKMLSLARSEFESGVHVFKSDIKLEEFEDYSIINGVKSMITSANYADYYLISVPKNSKGEMKNWLVPRTTEGLSFKESDWKGIGMKGNNSCPMIMENIKLDNKYGIKICRKTNPQPYEVNLDVIYFMTGLAGVYSGVCYSLYESALNHAKNRKYGENSLADIEAIQIHLSKLYTNVISAKGVLESAVNSFGKLEEDGFRKIMSARIIASENSIENANIAMRIGGGQAYNKKGNIERLMRDAYASQVMFPSIDVLRSWVGKNITGNSIL